MVYDDPKFEDPLHTRFEADQVMATNRRSFARPNANGLHKQQQQIDFGPPSSCQANQLQTTILNNANQQQQQQQYMNDGGHLRSKPFNTVSHLNSPRPHSFASIEHSAANAFHSKQRQNYLSERYHLSNNNNNNETRALQASKDEENDDELLDEDLYHVLSESHHHQLTNSKLEPGGCFHANEASDSSQRTSEMLAQSGSGSGSNSGAGASSSRNSNDRNEHLGRPNGNQMILNAREYDDIYYN